MIEKNISGGQTEATRPGVKDWTWQITAIKEAIKEADKGEFATKSQVKKTFNRWGVNG